ncbi:MAG: hypothetical protein FWD62_13280 [Betaproteobacteria bacterium]|nr:hypothetical protein [Betaproteobacteria bacterium]
MGQAVALERIVFIFNKNSVRLGYWLFFLFGIGTYFFIYLSGHDFVFAQKTFIWYGALIIAFAMASMALIRLAGFANEIDSGNKISDQINDALKRNAMNSTRCILTLVLLVLYVVGVGFFGGILVCAFFSVK